MVKKALIVGLNYPNQKHQLYGCVNDCLNWNALLEKQFGFEEIRVLIDQNPNGSVTTYPTQIPTKQNILSQLGWLCSGVQRGDTLAFVFAGHGCQVLQGSEYADEALVPEDFANTDEHGNPTLVFDDELHALFKRLPSGAFLTAVFDCSHAAHMLDVPTCIEDGQEIRQRNRPLQVHKRFEPAWRKNEHAFARPRFISPVHWNGPRHRRTEDGTGQHVGRMNLDPGVTAFSFAACSTHEVALDANIKAQQQGMMSFCLLGALAAKKNRCTYETLLEKAVDIAEDIRSKYMPSMDQHIHMSFCPNSPPSEVVVLDERYATVSQHRLSQQPQSQQPQRQEQQPQSAFPRQASSDFVPAPQYVPPSSTAHMEPPSSPMGRRPTTQESHSPMPVHRPPQETSSPMPTAGAGLGMDLRAYGLGPPPPFGAPAVGSYTQAPQSNVSATTAMADHGALGSPMPDRNIFGMPNLFSGIGDVNRGPSSGVSTGVPSMFGNLFSGSTTQAAQPTIPAAYSSQQQVYSSQQQPSSTQNAFASGAFSSQQAPLSQATYTSSAPVGSLQPGPARTTGALSSGLVNGVATGGMTARTTTTPHMNAYASGTSSAFASGAAGGGAMAAYQQMRLY